MLRRSAVQAVRVRTLCDKVQKSAQTKVFRSREEAENEDLVNWMNQMELEEVIEPAFTTQESIDLSKSIKKRFAKLAAPREVRVSLEMVQDAFASKNPVETLVSFGVGKAKAETVVKNLAAPKKVEVE